MLTIRRAAERGQADHGWLKSQHTFSFADYYDPQHMSFGPLRVINEDHIAAGSGFGSHPHRDMEIITYVLDGALAHQDSIGNQSVIRPGEVQRMSAGTGVVHSERNELADREAHILQIWITPATTGGKPGYGQKSFAADLARKPLVLVVSKDGRDGSIPINQDADLYLANLAPDASLRLPLRPARGAWLQVARGRISVAGEELRAGDGAAVTGSTALEVVGRDAAELLLFDLPLPT